jgi:hypothetical protein
MAAAQARLMPLLQRDHHGQPVIGFGWRGEFRFMVSAARRGSRRSGRLAARSQQLAEGAPLFRPLVTLTRARARPWSARCYGVARQRDRSRQNSTGSSVSPSRPFQPAKRQFVAAAAEGGGNGGDDLSRDVFGTTPGPSPFHLLLFQHKGEQ